MLFRSALVELRPFRTGLVLAAAGLMITLGSDHGGGVGNLLGGGLAKLLGSTGSLIVGATALVAGALLLTGASAGAILRRSGLAVRRASSAARRRVERPSRAERALCRRNTSRLDAPRPRAAGRRRPRLPGRRLRGLLGAAAAPRRRAGRGHADARSSTLPREQGEYVLPDRSVLKASPPQAGNASQANAQTAETLLQALAHFGVEATIVGQIAGPRVTRYELQLAPGTKVSKVAALKDDLSLRARDDGDPHPRADPGQAGRRRRGAGPLAANRHARRHLRRPARRPRARSRSGSARTSPARPSGPISRGCRTS